VPNHVPLNTGTLSAILADVAAHRHMEKATLIEILFG
jgi:hypothetical protein